MEFKPSHLSTKFALALLLLASPKAFAAGACESLFEASKPAAATSATAEAQASALFAKATQGISERGFIASFPKLTAELGSAAGKKGLIWWNLRIYVAESMEAAQKHSAAEADQLMQGVYLLNPRGEKVTEQNATEVFNRLMTENGLHYINRGTVEKIDPNYVKQNLTPHEMEWYFQDPEHGPVIMQSGWAFPKNRGVIKYSAGIESSTYARMRKLAQKLINQGFKVTFNKDFKQALDKTTHQARRVVTPSGEKVWVKNSRYLDDVDLYNSTLESFAQGRVFSVEIWNEKGEMVGGLIGNREGSIFSPDSVFYDNVNYPKISIDFAKISAIALMDRLNAAGIPFADAGMVSHFTASMKGELVPAKQFLDLVNQLPPESKAVVDFTKEWTP